MAELRFKTRGNSNPQGKPRVYFTCHPGDFDTYFEPVTELLLKYQNCAIWYSAGAEGFGEGEELELALGQMQLMVIPVTTKLLTEPNSAMDREFPFAEERHIPVLPLMEESGLGELFKKRFGSLQYLDPHTQDETAIGFEEKLERYLAGILVGDELAAKVRAAFDAYIFLSYRKKDRAYAQNLMRLIHSIPACRDIAIWYDEYLTPGENFNDAIADALRRSELFAMVVTPNLVNEENYVQTTEYPMALAEDKPILPVEMAATDPDALRTRFDALPPCLPGRANRAFSNGFLHAVRALALEENDAQPEHLFFIGLAHLDGIDVEVDSARALDLITGAAEAGLTEAMEKLISMYQEGKGVARDYETSAVWREKLVDALRQGDDPEAYYDALLQLGHARRHMGQLDKAEAAYTELQKAVRRMEEAELPAARGALAGTYYYLGVLQKARGRLSVAKSWYERALAIDQLLAEEVGSERLRRNLAFSFVQLGDIAESLGHLTEAREWYEKGLALRQTLAEENKTPQNMGSLASIYIDLGDLERQLLRPEEARGWYEKALALRQAQFQEENTTRSRRSLSLCYSRMGSAEEALGRLDEALTWLEKACAVSEQLAAELGTVQARRDLSVDYGRMGALEMEAGHPDKALPFFQKSLAISEQLAAETGTVQARRDLSVGYWRMASLEEQRRSLDKAREWYEKGMSIDETLARETDSPQSRRDLSVSYTRLGDLAQRRGRTDEARAWFEKSVAIDEQLADGSDKPQFHLDLYISSRRLALLETDLGHYGPAMAYHEKSLAAAEAYGELTGDHAREERTRSSIRDLSEMQTNIKSSSDKDSYKNL